MLLNEATTFFAMPCLTIFVSFPMRELAPSTAECIKANPFPCAVSEAVKNGFI